MIEDFERMREAVRRELAAMKLGVGEQHLSVEAAARLARVSVDTVEEWISAGYLPCFVVGRIRRVKKGELLLVAAQHAMRTRRAGGWL